METAQEIANRLGLSAEDIQAVKTANDEYDAQVQRVETGVAAARAQRLQEQLNA
jgi:hypothetical protein